MSPHELLAIGQVAAATGVAVSAVRYYEQLGLVDVAARVGGKRRFEPDAVARVSFVRRAQDAGFTLDEVGAVLDDRAGGWREVVDAKLSELLERREGIDTMIRVLGEIRDCGCEAVADCPRVGRR